MRFITLLGLMGILLLSGCQNWADKGGKTETTITSKEPIINNEGKVLGEKTTTIHVESQQPENPKTPAIINIEHDKNTGITKIDTTTGNSHNSSDAKIKGSLLNIIVYCGIALVVGGVAIGIFLKQIKWAVAVSATGAVMIIGAVLLAEYAVWFLVGFGILAVWGVFLLRDYIRQFKANNEQAKVLKELEEKGVVDTRKLPLSKTTRRIQESVIEKEKKKS